jgi:Domain of unknown function (DUF4386)
VKSARRTSTASGCLFIVATAAAIAAGALVPSLSHGDDLTTVAHHPHRLATAALLYLIAAGTSVGIAIALYPLLRKINAVLALASVVFRTIEAVFYTGAVVSLLAILPLGRQLATAPADGAAPIHAIAESLVSVRDQCSLVGVLAFCAGALMYYTLFYRSRLLPRWLSGWGVAGVLLLLTACLLALFSSNAVTGYTLLILPIGVQEMVLAIWLLVKGFNPLPATSTASSASSSTATGPAAVI